MKLKFAQGGKAVALKQSDFLAKGGGGEIYVVNDVVYKICHQGHMPPAKKLQELAVLDRPNIIRPLDSFAVDDGREGYTMRYVDNPIPLTQLVTVTYRNRNKITPDTMLNLVRKMQNGVEFVHQRKRLIVDLNEMNFLTDPKYDEIYFIDVDSYQTPSFPADVIMQTVRDRQVTTRDAKGNLMWTELSDMYSFGIVSFMMFIGMHPYKGANPKNPKATLDENMRDNVSILDPNVKFPKPAVLPFSVIPDVYMQWYKALFVDGKRALPPKDLVPVITVVTAKVHHVSGSNTFVVKEIGSYSSGVMDYYYSKEGLDPCEVVVNTEYQAFVNRHLVKSPPFTYKVGFAPGDRPIAAYVDKNRICLQDLLSGQPITFTASGEQVMSTGGRLYVKNHSQIFEVQFSTVAGQILASPHKIVDVADRATQLFSGVAIQSLFDAYNITVFTDPRQCRQFQVRELDGYKIVDAKYERRVLMVLAINTANGKYDRFIFRFARDWSSYDKRVVSDVPNIGLNFTVLPNHKVASITEDEQLEVFLSDKDHPAVKQIDDAVIEGDMILFSRENEVVFSKGQKLYTITARTP